MPKAKPMQLRLWWIVAIAAILALIWAHLPWFVYQIRKPVYNDICSEGEKQLMILEMAYASNLTAAEDAAALYSVRIAAGDGSIPIQNLRVLWRGTFIDLGEHPAWKRLILIMKVQDSAANVVLMHNLTYCNMREPWTIWPKSPEPQVFRMYEPEPQEMAEMTP